MAENTPPTEQELKDAGTDLDVIDKFVNEDPDFNGGTGIIDTRRGGQIQVLSKVKERADDAAAATEAVLAGVTAKQADVDFLVAQLQDGTPLDDLIAGYPDLILLVGYPPVDYATLVGTTISDQKVRFTDNGKLYGVRPENMPYLVPGTLTEADLYQLPDTLGSFELRITALENFHPEVGSVDWTGTLDDITITRGALINPVNLIYSDDDPQPSGTNNVRGFSHAAIDPILWEWRIIGGNGQLTLGFSKNPAGDVFSGELTSSGPSWVAGVYEEVTIQVRVPGGSWRSSDSFTLTVEDDGSNWVWDPGIPDRSVAIGGLMQMIDLTEAGTGDDSPQFSGKLALGMTLSGQFLNWYVDPQAYLTPGPVEVEITELRSGNKVVKTFTVTEAGDPPEIPFSKISF